MLWALSIVDLSLAAPAIASLTYIGNAIAAKLVLGENVDRRRWLAVLFVCIGVVLISH
jgi:drug/metabolite transporter (DMT)-like permease